jgi:hypothetical protein
LDLICRVHLDVQDAVDADAVTCDAVVDDVLLDLKSPETIAQVVSPPTNARIGANRQDRLFQEVVLDLHLLVIPTLRGVKQGTGIGGPRLRGKFNRTAMGRHQG